MSITTEDAFATALASVSPIALMAAYTDAAVVSGGAHGQVTGVYPDPATVLAGVAYGPSGSDYVGTLAYATAADIAAAVRAELTDELTRIDVAVSTRSTISDVFAAV